MITRLRAWGLCAALVLTACGDSGGGNGTPGPTGLASLQPYGLTAFARNAGITLNWPRISGAVSFNLYWATSSGGLKNKIAGVTPPYEHGVLANGSVYYYTYTVVRAEGESAYSVELPAVPNAPTDYANPSDPKDCSVDAQCNDLTPYAGNGQVQLFWSGIANAYQYNLYWKTAHGVTIADTKVEDVTSPFVLTVPTNDAPYYFVVTAVIGASNGPESEVSREVVAMPYAPEPLTPVNVTATPGSGQVSLTWDVVTNATSYSLLWSTSSPVTASATRIDNVTSPYVHTGLTDGQHYYYALVALNDRGPSPLSAEADVQPAAGGAVVPAIPAGAAPDMPKHVKAFAGHLQNTINADEDSNAARYTIYWNTTGSVTTADGSITDVTLPYTHTGLTDGTRVYYRLVAMNRYGASDLSAEASAVPQNAFIEDTVSSISDGVLKDCITNMAADNGWSYVRQVDFLYCDQTGATAIAGMTGIEAFPNLIWMHIINEGAVSADVSAVAQLPNLSTLTLRGMQLSTASVESVIGPLVHLTYLDLYQNYLDTVPALPADMAYLQLENNQIVDVSPLASLTALQELYLSENAIGGSGVGKVNSLTTLTQASWITLGGNPAMSCAELMALRDELGSSVVIRNLDYTKDPWEPLLFPVSLSELLTAGDCI